MRNEENDIISHSECLDTNERTNEQTNKHMHIYSKRKFIPRQELQLEKGQIHIEGKRWFWDQQYRAIKLCWPTDGLKGLYDLWIPEMSVKTHLYL